MLYFGKSAFLSFMSCLHTNQFSYEGCTICLHYYSSLINGRIHANIHLFIHVIRSLFFSLVFMCILVRILSIKIYFLCFFLAYFLIALKLLFIHLQLWIHARTHTNTPSQLGKINERLTNTHGLHLLVNKVRLYPCE